MTGSTVAGRDVKTTNNDNRRTLRIGIGAAALVALLGAGGGIAYYAASDSTPGSVVYETGVQGAVDTANQLHQAEIGMDSDSWCLLASSKDSQTCRVLMSNSFSTSACNGSRSELGEVETGPPEGDGDAVNIPISMNGRAIGDVPMVFTGNRWELSPAFYELAMMDGGVFMAAVEAENGNGSFLGVQVPAS